MTALMHNLIMLEQKKKKKKKKKGRIENKKTKISVRGGIRTHAHIRGPESSDSHREQG